MVKERCKAKGSSSQACLAAARKGYEAQRWAEAHSVITYDAEARISADGSSIKAFSGVKSCHPGD
jgi:hypothetical protein